MKVKSHTVLLLFIIVLCAALYAIAYKVHDQSPVVTWLRATASERFSELVPPEKVIVYQGNGVPDQPVAPMTYDQHGSFPSVDGTEEGPRSLFMMSFNKCDPSCCPSTYSCSGGCVCMTKEQQNFVGTRGSNNKGTQCSGGPSDI